MSTSKQCRNGDHPIDARTLAAGGEVCYDCATSTLKASATPGPWKATFAAGAFIVQNEQHRTISHCQLRDAEDEANARLIAAAPEMLRVIKALDGEAILRIHNRLPDVNVDDLIARIDGSEG